MGKEKKENMTQKEIELIKRAFEEDPELSAMVKKFKKQLGVERYSDRLDEV